MITVRKYKSEDIKEIENICLQTSYLPESLNESVLEVYIRPYFNFKKCGVLIAIEDEKVLGYIAYSNSYKSFYIDSLNMINREVNNITKTIMLQEVNSLKEFSKSYPSHIHIDVKKGNEHHGIGTLLINELCSLLKKEKSKGIMLETAKDNENAIRFYKKMGFDILKEDTYILMGKKL